MNMSHPFKHFRKFGKIVVWEGYSAFLEDCLTIDPQYEYFTKGEKLKTPTTHKHTEV